MFSSTADSITTNVTSSSEHFHEDLHENIINIASLASTVQPTSTSAQRMQNIIYNRFNRDNRFD